MKKYKIFLIIFFTIFLVGCDDIGHSIMMDVLGPFSFLSGSGSKSNTVKNTSATQSTTTAETIKCGSNEFYNTVKKRCECVDGYFMQNGKCVSESSKECVFDADCSPTGVVSVCKDKYTKQVYRCDLRTNKCINGKGRVAETIDCRIDFGNNAICQGGLCMLAPMAPMQP
jgi:hypothetical protein